MKIAFGCDHGGYELKKELIKYLGERYETVDCGTFSKERCDYPDYAEAVCRCINTGEADIGVLVCKTGMGMCMCANKMEGIRCALVKSDYLVTMARKHNNANVIALGQGDTSEEDARRYCDLFISTEFEGGRHENRVRKMMSLK
ncbi:MAG: ribose 5-phosphate isomerase B [Clostridia bacterium]|nr:ribose 5-phosphate isomerase B [Clostridia bacterium]